MSDRIPIQPITIEGVAATSIFISLVMYRAGDTSRKLYYGFYDEDGALIPNGEGNLILSGGMGESIDTQIEALMTSSVSDATDILLRINQAFSSEYSFEYRQSGVVKQTNVEGSAITSTQHNEIVNYVCTQLSVDRYEPLVLYVKTVAQSKGCTTTEVTALMNKAQSIIDNGHLDQIITWFAYCGDSLDNKLWDMMNHTHQMTKTGSPVNHADGVSIPNTSGADKLTSNFAPGVDGFASGYGILKSHPNMTVLAYYKDASAAYVSNSGNITLITFDGGGSNNSYPYLGGDNSSNYTFTASTTLKGLWSWRRKLIAGPTQIVEVEVNGTLIHTSSPQNFAGFGTGNLVHATRANNGAAAVRVLDAKLIEISDSDTTSIRTIINSFVTAINRNAS